MDVHFVDSDDGKSIGMQTDFGEPEAVGAIMMFADFLKRSDDAERAHFAGTIHSLATVLARGLTAGALELEAPKDPPSGQAVSADDKPAGRVSVATEAR